MSSGASSGCEAGAGPSSANPTAPSPDGTSLGNTTHSDILYIPVPLFAPTPPTQCIATATCIDHPPTIDLSRIAAALPGNPAPSKLTNVPIPAHDHFVTTRNNGLPEWWNVKVVPFSNLATWDAFVGSGNLTPAQEGGAVPTNAFLFFQILPGSVPANLAVNQGPNTPNSPPGPGVATAPSPTAANQTETGTTFNNLANDCGASAPNCQNVGISHDWIGGQDVQALYTEQYFCGAAADGKPVGSQSGCEAGAAASTVPPGVSDTTAPNQTATPAVTNSQIDPLYIPVPLYANPPVPYNQCAAAIVCIDHPATIDLSRLSSVLGASPSALANVPLPGHDHLLSTRNADQPEWWDVIVIPVTSPQGLASIEATKSYTAVKALEQTPGSGIGGEVPTNAYLWFQTLPGAGAPTPGPVQTNCHTTLPSGSVVGAAALPDGTGYIETDAAGDVAVFGAAACYGDLTGTPLNKPIVGIAADRTTGGYWLVAADGGVFSFNAPFYGSTGNITLNKPVVGMAPVSDGSGYRLVASDGGVFDFNTPFYGSTGNITLNKPVVGGMNNNSYDGYWLVASDGGIFTFSPPNENMPFFGSGV